MYRHVLLLSFCIMVLAQAGCRAPEGQDPLTGPGPLAPQVDRGQATVRLWTIWNTEPRASALADIVNAFEAQNPGIKIEVSAFEPDAYKTSIRVALGGEQPPDIFFVWSGEKMLHSFVRGGNIADITAELDADGGTWRNRIPPASLQPYTFDSKTYGVPYLLQCTFFLYNTQMFAENGWEVPQDWDELLALTQRIKQKNIIPIALGNLQKWPAHHYPCVLVQRLIGADAAERQYDPLGPGAYDDPAWTKALAMFMDLADRGAFNPSPNGTDRSSARVLFYSGRAAMFYTGTWDFARLAEGGEAPESFIDSWDFFNFPAVPGGTGDQTALAGSPDGYVISSRSPNKQAAVTFLQFMTSQEQAAGFVEKCQELVQVKGAVTEANAGKRLARYMEMVENASRIHAWADTLMEESVAQAYMGGVQELLEKRITPEEVMQRVRDRQKAVRREIMAREEAER